MKERKYFKIVLIINSIILGILGIVLCIGRNRLDSEKMVIIGLTFTLFVVIEVCIGILYLKSFYSLHKLEKYGYEIPEDKKRYDGTIDLLPRINIAPYGDDAKYVYNERL